MPVYRRTDAMPRERIEELVASLRPGDLLVASIDGVAEVGLVGSFVRMDEDRIVLQRHPDGELVTYPVAATTWIGLIDGPAMSKREVEEALGEPLEDDLEWGRRW